MNVPKIKLCEIRKEHMFDKQIRDVLDTVIRAVDTRPKNRFSINLKSPYKEYIYNQYEGEKF